MMTDCNCDTFPGNLTVLGNLGIGTSSPQAGLNIVGANASLRVGSTPQAGLDYNDGSGDLYVGGSSAQDGDIFINDLNGVVQIALRAEGGGYLGLGTQYPQVGLHVAGVQSFRVGNTPLAGLDFNNATGDLYVGGANAQDGDIFVNDLNGVIQIAIKADAGGSLGIGTSSPQAGLHVMGANASLRVGSTPLAGLDYNDGSGDLYVGGSNGQDGDVFVNDLNGNIQIALRAESRSIVLGTRTVADLNGCYYA